MEDEDCFTIYNVWNFVHTDEFTTDIIIEDIKEVYSTGPAETEDGTVVEQEGERIQFYSYTRDDNLDGMTPRTPRTHPLTPRQRLEDKSNGQQEDSGSADDSEDEDDVHETKFLLRFLATNTDSANRYLWVTDDGAVRADGGYTNIATFFEVVHWCSPHQDNYQLICYGGLCKGFILYMDGAELKTRKYHASTDDRDITTKFQMSSRGSDISVRAFISKTGVPIYFDSDGNYKPEGPVRDGSEDGDSTMHPLFFITSNVKVLKVTSV